MQFHLMGPFLCFDKDMLLAAGEQMKEGLG